MRTVAWETLTTDRGMEKGANGEFAIARAMVF